MPLYEYHCGTCREDIEILVRGEEQVVCPDCGGQDLGRLLSAPAAHTRGGELNVCERPAPGPCGMGGCGLPECG